MQGALRRRFYRGAAGATTRLEVEVLHGRGSRAPAERPACGQASRRSRITTPIRGLGAKDVDLRGIRIPSGGGGHHLGDGGRVDGDHDARLPRGGVQRLVEAVVVADLLVRDSPRGQQRLVQHRRVHRRWCGRSGSTAQARPSETTNEARSESPVPPPAARRPPPGPGSRPKLVAPLGARPPDMSDIVSAATERWIGPIRSG